MVRERMTGFGRHEVDEVFESVNHRDTEIRSIIDTLRDEHLTESGERALVDEVPVARKQLVKFDRVGSWYGGTKRRRDVDHGTFIFVGS